MSCSSFCLQRWPLGGDFKRKPSRQYLNFLIPLSLLILCFLWITGVNFHISANTPKRLQVNHPEPDDKHGDFHPSTFAKHPRNICKCPTNQRDVGKKLKKLPRKGQVSTCSDEATMVGPNQKVVSFSLYFVPSFKSEPRNTMAELLNGVQVNMDGIRVNYSSDWVARVYTNLRPNHSHTSCKLICDYSDILYWCDISQIPQLGDLSGMIGRTWRFLPLGDPLVDSFVSRDLDSYISQREWGVVAEWQLMRYPIHAMRDSPYHNTHLLLAGMFGVKNSMLPAGLGKRIQRKIIKKSKLLAPLGLLNSDQDILDKFVGVPLKNLTLAHDSYLCDDSKFKVGLTLPFNTKRPGGFYVGGFRLNEGDRVRPCPEICRPSYGQDWTCC